MCSSDLLRGSVPVMMTSWSVSRAYTVSLQMLCQGAVRGALPSSAPVPCFCCDILPLDIHVTHSYLAWSIPTPTHCQSPAIWQLSSPLGRAPVSDLLKGLGITSILSVAPLMSSLSPAHSFRLFRFLIPLLPQDSLPWTSLYTQ